MKWNRYDATPSDYVSVIITDYGMVSWFFDLIQSTAEDKSAWFSVMIYSSNHLFICVIKLIIIISWVMTRNFYFWNHKRAYSMNFRLFLKQGGPRNCHVSPITVGDVSGLNSHPDIIYHADATKYSNEIRNINWICVLDSFYL